MGDQVTAASVAGIVVRIEMDDTDVFLAVHVGEPGDVGELDGVITPDDDGNRSRLSDLPNHPPNRRHAALHAQVVDGRVAVVHGLQLPLPAHHRLHAAAATPERAHRGGTLASASKADPHVDRCSDERHLHFASDQVLDRHRDGQPEEAQGRPDSDGSGLSRWIVRDVPISPHLEVLVVRVQANDRQLRIHFLLALLLAFRWLGLVGARLRSGLGGLGGRLWCTANREHQHQQNRDRPPD